MRGKEFNEDKITSHILVLDQARPINGPNMLIHFLQIGLQNDLMFGPLSPKQGSREPRNPRFGSDSRGQKLHGSDHATRF